MLSQIPESQQTIKILILSANPRGTSKLRLDEEKREIKEGLRRSKYREQFTLETLEAVRSRDIHRAILDYEPNIIHFSGHGTGEEGLALEDEIGEVKLVDADTLAELFELFAMQVECVILNACYSEVQANAIVQHIPYVIGMTQAIGDKAAIEFAVGFYDALGAGKTVEFSQKLGCNAIRRAGIAEHLIPVLIKKPDIEENQAENNSNLGRKTFSDHKYNGELVCINLRFYENSEVCRIQQIGIELDIAFGEVEEVFPYRNQFLGRVKSYIRFGIKHGKLCLVLNNGVIPLNQRQLNSDPQGVWQVRTTGIETNPVWEFETRGQPPVLGGSRCHENLGIMNLSGTNCVVQATFKAQINNNDLEIMAQDGAWGNNDTPQVIATKRSLFFKRFVKPRLSDYLSRVVLEYDSAIIS